MERKEKKWVHRFLLSSPLSNDHQSHTASFFTILSPSFSNGADELWHNCTMYHTRPKIWRRELYCNSSYNKRTNVRKNTYQSKKKNSGRIERREEIRSSAHLLYVSWGLTRGTYFFFVIPSFLYTQTYSLIPSHSLHYIRSIRLFSFDFLSKLASLESSIFCCEKEVWSVCMEEERISWRNVFSYRKSRECILKVWKLSPLRKDRFYW